MRARGGSSPTPPGARGAHDRSRARRPTTDRAGLRRRGRRVLGPAPRRSPWHLRHSDRLESRLSRVLVASTLGRVVEALDGRSLDAVVCMGVLEHLPLRERARFFDFCARHLAPRRRVVIDVPVEIGPTLLVKQFGRRVLKRRGREYGPGELLGAVAGRRTVDPNRHGAGSDPDFIYTHKGFDHRVFRKELERHQEIHRGGRHAAAPTAELARQPGGHLREPPACWCGRT